MTPENTKKLYEAFPSLYRRQSETAIELMRYGFECDDGWFDLIWNLSRAIEEVARQQGLNPQSDEWPEAVQVKQKFGTLRFYLTKYDETMHSLIEQAIKASGKTCEVCGAPGSLIATLRYRVKTLCYGHAEEFLKKVSIN